MRVYKLLRVRKDGSLGSLYINKKARLPVGVWMEACCFPTKGYKERPFWHCTGFPRADHLSIKGRAWYEVEIEEYSEFLRPAHQGGIWYLAKRMKICGKALTK